MRSNVKRQNRGTSSADLAERANGYTANGVSEWERHAAEGHQPNIRHRHNQTAGMTRLEALIFENCKELARLEERISSERDPEVISRCICNSRKKRKFIDALRAEQREGRR